MLPLLLSVLVSPSLPQDPRGAGSAAAVSARITELAYRERHALIIGVSEYTNAPNLSYADDDARAIQTVLVKQFGFKSDNVRLLLDRDATTANIRQAFIDLHKQDRVQPNDSILVFLAGHGTLLDDGVGAPVGFFLPTDAPPGLYKQNLSVAEAEDKSIRIGRVIRDLFARSPAKHILVIADFCYGGILIEQSGDTLDRRRGPWAPAEQDREGAAVDLIDAPTENSLLFMLKGRGREIISAGDKLAFEHSDLKHGALTGVLLKLLEGVASDPEPYSFHLEHIKRYVEYSVEELSHGGQRPRYFSETGQGRYIFAPKGIYAYFDPTRRQSLPNALRDFKKFADSIPEVVRVGPDGTRYVGRLTLSIETGRLKLLEDQKWFPGEKAALPKHGQIVARSVNLMDLVEDPVLTTISSKGEYSWLSKPGLRWFVRENAPLVQVDLQDFGAPKSTRVFSDEITVSFETELVRAAFIEHIRSVRKKVKEALGNP